MKAPRMRWNVRTAMAAIVVAALLMTGVRVWRRPRPVTGVPTEANHVVWSDGTQSVVNDGPYELEIRPFAFLQLVRWPDGSHSLYARPLW